MFTMTNSKTKRMMNNLTTWRINSAKLGFLGQRGKNEIGHITVARVEKAQPCRETKKLLLKRKTTQEDRKYQCFPVFGPSGRDPKSSIGLDALIFQHSIMNHTIVLLSPINSENGTEAMAPIYSSSKRERPMSSADTSLRKQLPGMCNEGRQGASCGPCPSI